ncbi:MAG: replication initiation protein [Suipraeoptans sp.]
MMNESAKRSTQIAKKKRGVIRARSNFFRSARYGLTLQEHRIIYYAILKGQQEKRPFEPVTLSVSEFVELCEVKGNSYYGKIRNLSKKITGRVVEFVYKDKDGEHLLQAPWLVGVTYNTREGTVTISPNKKIQPFFEGKPFTETEYYFLIRFTSQYAERLYEIIKSLDYKKLVDFDIDDLRQRLAISETQYTNFKDLRRRALEPAIKDINEFTDLELQMKEVRGYRNKVIKVIFVVDKKKIERLADRVQRGEYRAPLTEEKSQKLLQELLGEDEVEQLSLE